MHCLHRILVYIPDETPLPCDTKEDLLRRVRSYAENATDGYYERTFDWRETDTAGRWASLYTPNVMFAKDDSQKFLSELKSVLEAQRSEISSCEKELQTANGNDLGVIVERLWERTHFSEGKTSEELLAPYFLHKLSSLLSGEYISDSFFYNAHDYTARLYSNDLSKIESSIEDWALVFFDYHN